MLGPLLTKAVAANPKVTLVKINVDDNQEIAADFKVRNRLYVCMCTCIMELML